MVRAAPSWAGSARYLAWRVGFLLTLMAALSYPLLGQQADQPGWFGVRVQQQHECVWEMADEWRICNLVLVVSEMQESGPAARGGIRLGDRLFALNGEQIDFQNWSRLIRSIRAGTPVNVAILRGKDRHFVHIIPAPRPLDAEQTRMIERVTESDGVSGVRSAFVSILTEPEGSDGTAFALAVRNTDNQNVAVEPSMVRVIDGQLHVLRLNVGVVTRQNLQHELVGDLQRVTESTYDSARHTLEMFDRVRARLPMLEFQRELSRIAQVGLQESGLAIRFRRSFGGAEFEPVRRYVGRAGLLVLRVAPRTVTARLGLRPGDVVVEAGNVPTRQVPDLIQAINGAQGSGFSIRWIRDGREMVQPWPGN